MNQPQQNVKPNWPNRIETILLSATAIISLLVSLLDFIGVLDSIQWLAQRIPILTFLAIGIVAAYLVVERRNQLERMERDSHQRIEALTQTVHNSTSTIVESLKGVYFRQFETADELMRHVNKRLLQARLRVDDLSWSSLGSLKYGLNIDEKVNEEYSERIARISRKIPFREIFIFNRPGRIEKLRRRVEENIPGYSCAYYNESQIPLLQFMVIDEEEIIFSSDQFPSQFAIRHPLLAKLFTLYYEEIWKNAIPLKHGTTLYRDSINKILSIEEKQLC